MELVFFDIKNGEKKELARFSEHNIKIGRDPDDVGLKLIDYSAVSSNHCQVMFYNDDWFFFDLGSTNGSWLNNEEVFEGEIKLLRSGDILQLADAALEVEINHVPSLKRSAIVFESGQYLKHYNIPEKGRALAIGSDGTTIEVAEKKDTLSALIVERRAEKIYAYKQDQTLEILLNGNLIGHMAEVKDRDNITILTYDIFISDHLKKSDAHGSTIKLTMQTKQASQEVDIDQGISSPKAVSPTLSDVESSVRPPQKGFANPGFGRAKYTSPSGSYQSGAHRARSSSYFSRGLRFNTIEDQLILILGLSMLLLLFAILVWFIVT